MLRRSRTTATPIWAGTAPLEALLWQIAEFSGDAHGPMQRPMIKPTATIYLRSFVFNVGFYLLTIVAAVACAPLLLGPRELVRRAVASYAKLILFLLRVTVNLTIEVRHLEKLPPDTCVIASKHQSSWETVAYLAIWPDPVMFLKRELFYIPLWGWYVRKLGMIAVHRSGGHAAIRRMISGARPHIGADRQLIIFPEGTRRRPFDIPQYKPGVFALYQRFRLPCIPVALDSGYYWPRRSFLKYPGRVVVELLDPILPGLTRREFEHRMESTIESATNNLLSEARLPE
jgi:1-acyl-sn-glycerol-3-phosphate acyltransferase